MALVAECYQATSALPSSEQYGLVSQIRRAAVSVPSNLAEGHGRAHTGDYLRHISIAYGSLMELETQILIAIKLEMMARGTGGSLLGKAAEIGRMLNGLERSLKNRKP